MDLLNFINTYWTILAGIASFILAFAYIQFKVSELESKIKEQKETHDKTIVCLQLEVTSLETKVGELKDKTFEVISLIQQDIREIMTILRDKRA